MNDCAAVMAPNASNKSLGRRSAIDRSACALHLCGKEWIADVVRIHQVNRRAQDLFQSFGEVDDPLGTRTVQRRIEFNQEVEVALPWLEGARGCRTKQLEPLDPQALTQRADRVGVRARLGCMAALSCRTARFDRGNRSLATRLHARADESRSS